MNSHFILFCLLPLFSPCWCFRQQARVVIRQATPQRICCFALVGVPFLQTQSRCCVLSPTTFVRGCINVFRLWCYSSGFCFIPFFLAGAERDQQTRVTIMQQHNNAIVVGENTEQRLGRKYRNINKCKNLFCSVCF